MPQGPVVGVLGDRFGRRPMLPGSHGAAASDSMLKDRHARLLRLLACLLASQFATIVSLAKLAPACLRPEEGLQCVHKQQAAASCSKLRSWGVYYFQWKFYWFFVASLIPAFVPAQAGSGFETETGGEGLLLHRLGVRCCCRCGSWT